MSQPETPFISVVIPVYNPGKYLAPMLRSLAAQDYPNFEVLLVDDGSTDGSADFAGEWCRADSRFRLFRQPNSGAAAARANGLRRAGGDYVILMDSDDLIHPQMLSALAGAAVSENVPLAFCRFAPFSGTDPADGAISEQAQLFPAPAHLEMLLHDQRLDYALSNKLFAKGVLTPEMLECPYRYNEDLLASWRAFRTVNRAAFLDFDGYHCRQHSGSVSHQGISRRFISDQWEVAKLILADAQGTEMTQSAEAFYDEKLAYLMSMILRQPNPKELADLQNTLQAELRKRTGRALSNPRLSAAMKVSAFAGGWLTPIWRQVCRALLRDRR